MRTHLLALVCSLAGRAALAQHGAALHLPVSAPGMAAYHQLAWPVLDSLPGDLNGDEATDYILVYRQPAAPHRLALAAIIEAEGRYQLADSTTRLLPPDDAQPYRLATHYEPLNAQTLFLEEDTLVYQTNLSGRERGVTTTARFCLHKGRMALVGYGEHIRPPGKRGEEYLYTLPTGLVRWTDAAGKASAIPQPFAGPLPGWGHLKPEGYLTDETLRRMGKAVR